MLTLNCYVLYVLCVVGAWRSSHVPNLPTLNAIPKSACTAGKRLCFHGCLCGRRAIWSTCAWSELLTNSLVFSLLAICCLTILLQLFKNLCPRTCANFKALCTGEEGECYPGVFMSYCGTKLHRLVVNGWIQGGGMPCVKLAVKGGQCIVVMILSW